MKINLAKSELVPVSNVNNVEDLARILGCKVSSLPMKYLGMEGVFISTTFTIGDGSKNRFWHDM